MSFSCPGLSLDEMLSAAEYFGYDAVEPRVASGHKHGIELEVSAGEREAIRKKIGGSRIKISCLATACIYADPKTSNHYAEETRRYVDLAAEVGAPRIRVFGGVIPGDSSREAAIDLVSKSLGSVADHALKKGVTVCMETHDDWCDPVNMAAVMKKVSHPAVKINWDIMHPVLKENKTIEQSFEILRPWVDHVHFHDGVRIFDDDKEYKMQFRPIGEGGVNHREALKLLQDISYDGYLSGEWIDWEPYDIHLPRELATIKGYEEVM